MLLKARSESTGLFFTLYAMHVVYSPRYHIDIGRQVECLFYLAGADPYEQDQLGGLRLTLDRLRAGDRWREVVND